MDTERAKNRLPLLLAAGLVAVGFAVPARADDPKTRASDLFHEALNGPDVFNLRNLVYFRNRVGDPTDLVFQKSRRSQFSSAKQRCPKRSAGNFLWPSSQ